MTSKLQTIHQDFVSLSINDGGRNTTHIGLADRRDQIQKFSTDIPILYKGKKGNCDLANVLPIRHEVDCLGHH